MVNGVFHYNQLIFTFMILSAIFFGVSILIFFIGIIAIYLHNILINTRNLPLFIIDSDKKQSDKSLSSKEEDRIRN